MLMLPSVRNESLLNQEMGSVENSEHLQKAGKYTSQYTRLTGKQDSLFHAAICKAVK